MNYSRRGWYIPGWNSINTKLVEEIKDSWLEGITSYEAFQNIVGRKWEGSIYINTESYSIVKRPWYGERYFERISGAIISRNRTDTKVDIHISPSLGEKTKRDSRWNDNDTRWKNVLSKVKSKASSLRGIAENRKYSGQWPKDKEAGRNKARNSPCQVLRLTQHQRK